MTEPFFALTRDPRLSPYATSALAAWLWGADGTRVLWANASGAALLGAANPAALTETSFLGHELGAQIAAIAAELPDAGVARSARLTGVTPHDALACTCSRETFGDTAAIFILAAAPVQPVLPLAERVARMFGARSAPFAVFSGMGALLFAPAQVADKLGPATTLAALDAGALMAQAIASGHAQGTSAIGPLTLERMGSGGATVLVATLERTAQEIAANSPELEAEQRQIPSEYANFASQPVGATLADVSAALLSPSQPAVAGMAGKPADLEPPTAAEPGMAARPVLTVVPAAENVVPFRAAAPAVEKRPVLTPVERSAFREIGETLGSAAPDRGSAAPERGSAAPERREQEEPHAEPLPSAFATGLDPERQSAAETEARAVLDRLPVGILVHHGEQLLYANRALLEWTGYADIAALTQAGGLERLVIAPGAPLDRHNGTGKSFLIATRGGGTLACEGRLYTVPWDGSPALMLVLMRSLADGRIESAEAALRAAEAETRELRQILDAAADGVVMIDREGRVLAANRAAEALFGTPYHDIARRPFVELLAPESEGAARAYLDEVTGAAALNEAREVTGRTRAGTPIPLYMTLRRIGEGEKLCAVFRDLSPCKRAEQDITSAKRNAEHASSAKSDFLAKISHEIRTPLNAILGFSEVMMEERFGRLGNERYREYLKDIHASGGHLVSLVNDLLDLSKIEAGKLDLVFARVNLNQIVAQCVGLMQPQANQSRIIIRTSLSPSVTAVTADARSVRQIVLNLLSNAIKFTGAGGQVIVSTAVSERGIALRVRDTGAGMTSKEIETALAPFRPLATSPRAGSGGAGLGLPLTKALAEANGARFSVESAVDSGTLVEITFPGTRVLAE